MNVIDEWVNSESAKRDALKFKNACDSMDSLRYCALIMQSRNCGKIELARRLAIEKEKTMETKWSAHINRANLYGYDTLRDPGRNHLLCVTVDATLDGLVDRSSTPVFRITFMMAEGDIRRVVFRYMPSSFDWVRDRILSSTGIYITPGRNKLFLSKCCDRIRNVLMVHGYDENFNKVKETKDMSRNAMLKNIVGSDIYIKMNDGSNDVVYIGRGEGLDFDIDCGNLSGNISFVGADEPLGDELRKIRRSFIKKVIFNNPATIVFWRDGSKTIVKMNGKDKKFDPEKGLAMAIVKKCLGNEGNYYNTFTKFLPEEKAVKKSAKK